MRIVRNALCIGATILSGGCVVKYQAPVEAPKATITFAAEDRFTFGKLRVQAFADEHCSKSPHGTRIAYYFMKMYDPHTGVDREVEAGKEFVYSWVFGLGTAGITNTTSCAVTSAFVPAPGEKYKATFGFSADECFATVQRVSQTDGALEAVAARQIKPACVENFSD